METNILSLFRQYNQLIAKHQKVISYFEKYPEQFDANLDKYQQLKNEIVGTMKEIAKHGYVMCADEVLEGFRQIKYLEV